MDLVSQGKSYTEEEVRYIHSCKTGALIEASVSTAALLCMAPGSARRRLSAYARQVGLCFQIVDDLLDVEGSQSELGKGSQKDALLEKATYPALLGVRRSHEIADRLVRQATREVSFLGSRARMLIGIAAFISSRRH